MTKSLLRIRALMIVGSRVTLGAVILSAIACVQSDPTSPTRATSGANVAARTDVASSTNQGPQSCMPDSKLLGRFVVSTADVPGTWWRLTKDRFDALGVSDYKGALEGFYGQNFATLNSAIQYLIDGVATWDTNANGYVCAFEINGTRAHLGVNANYLIGIADDKHAEN